MTNPLPETNLPLKEAIASLRNELRSAIDESDAKLPLEVQELELELTLEATGEIGAEAGANLWSVVTGKLSAKDSEKRLHRLRIVLNPLDPKHPGDDGKPGKARMSSEF